MEEKQQNKLQHSYSGALKAILPKFPLRTDELNSDFPNRRNFHYKRAFSKFVTNKFNKVNYLPNIVELNLDFAKKKQPDHQVLRFTETHRSDSSNNSRLKTDKENIQEIVDTFENEEKKVHTHLIDLRKFSPKTDKSQRKERKEFKQSKKIRKSKSVQLRENPNYPSPKPQSQPAEQSDELEEEELKKIYCPSPLKSSSKLKHVIDLNFVSANSRLSEHFLRPYSNNLEQNEYSLSDMNLNEMWPNSTMAKQAAKASPWINTFKAKSLANEINRNYCESSLDPSRTDYVNFLPNLKTPEAPNSVANSRLENNNSTTKKYSFFLPEIKISYCQKQIL